MVVYYSWSGHTEQIAKGKIEKEGADLFEVKDVRKPGTLAAYTAGCFRAMRMKRAPVKPIGITLDDYERIIIMSPVWAGHPAPAIYNVFDILPAGKNVEVYMVSGSGSSGCEQKVRALVENKACRLTKYEDIKG